MQHLGLGRMSAPSHQLHPVPSWHANELAKSNEAKLQIVCILGRTIKMVSP